VILNRRREASLRRPQERGVEGGREGQYLPRHRLAAGVAAALLACLVAGCGGGGGKRSIVLYNGQHTQLTAALISAFEKQSGISVRVRTGDSLVLADQILEEGHGSPADVFLSENSPELMTLQERGFLAKLPSSILDQVSAGDDSPSGNWVGVALRVSALVCDPALLSGSELPKSILDLAQPQWKGKIAIAPIDSDFPPLVGAVIETYGINAATSWLEGLKHNAATYQDDESVVAAVNRGDVACGVINQYYWYRLRLELGQGAMHSTLYYFPAGNVGSVTNISGAAVLASSKQQQAADRFLRFIVSPQGQEIIAQSDDFEYPARPGIKPNVALPPLAKIAHDTLSPVELGDDAQAARLLQQVGLY
jgi:iron(III) transport system substrate-binding protein